MNQIVHGINGGLAGEDHSKSLSTDGGNCKGSSCSGVILKKGPWSSAEDAILVAYVKKHGEGNWNAIQKSTGLLRCGKSCRLRWVNHLRPNLKKGAFTPEEERLIIELHAKMGNKWARVAAHLPGRTDNEIKNYWNTRIKRSRRAGLPVYPPELYSQESRDRQFRHSTSNSTSGVKGNQTSLQATDFKIAGINFSGIKVNQSVSAYVPEPQHISASGMKFKIPSASEHYGLIAPTNHCNKSLQELNWKFPGFNHPIKGGSLTLKQTQNCSHKSAQPFRLSLAKTSDLSVSKPPLEAVKSELPSVQYLETYSGIGDRFCPPLPSCEFQDTCLCSLPMGKIQSGTLSKNSGLLDALIPCAWTSHTAMQISSTKSSNSSAYTPTDGIESSAFSQCRTATDAELCLDNVSPISQATTSILCERTTTGARESMSNQSATGACSGSNLKLEAVEQVRNTNGEKDEFSDWMDFSSPDYLLDAECISEEATMNHAVGTLENDNTGFYHGPDATGSSQSSPSWGWGWGWGSYAWNNMPAVYQLPELH